MDPPIDGEPRAGLLLQVALGLLALTLGWLALAGASPGSTDDVFIVLTYGRNLLEHGALAHELGEGRLEGFTSPLDLGLKTLLLAIGGPDGVRSAWWGSLTLYLAACLACARLALRMTGPRPARAALATAFLVLTPGLADATTYLLEAPLVVLVLVVLLERLRPETGWVELALLTVLAMLTRPELVLVAWVLGAPWRSAARYQAFAVLGPVIALTFLRYLFFGAPFPNTFVAKSSDHRWNEISDGAAYVTQFLTPSDVWGALVSVIVLATIAGPWLPLPERWRHARWVGPAMLIGVVYTGGDGYAGARLLLPALFLGGAVTVAASGGGSRVALVALTLVLVGRLGSLLPVARHAFQPVTGLSEADFGGEVRALEALRDRLPEGATLASRHLQMAEYFVPELGFLDLTGLNDRAVAETPAPGPVSFGRTSLAPAVEAEVEAIHLHHQVLSGTILGRRSTASWLAATAEERQVLGDPLPSAGPVAEALVAGYRPVTLLHVGGAGRHLNLLVRADLAGDWAGEPGVRVGPHP